MTSNSDDRRSYHTTASAYSLPNDATEHERLDAQSRALTTMIGRRPFLTDLHAFAEGQSAFKAVDVGCGTGILTTALAREVQQSGSRTKIYGVDISPVPLVHERPESVEYVQANFEDLPGADSRFQLDSFDFITHRMLIFGIANWPNYIRLCFSLLKPGGRIEIQDIALRWFDIQGVENSPTPKWVNVMRKATSKLGFDSLAPETLKQLMLDNGFVDVVEKKFPWHTTEEHWEEYPDSDEIGYYTVHSLHPTFVRSLSMMAEKASLQNNCDFDGLEGVKGLEDDYYRSRSAARKGNHANFYVVCGRRP